MQAKVNIEDSDNEESLANKVHTQEHIAYPLVVKWFTEGRLELKDNLAWLDQQCLQVPVILNELNPE